MSNGRSNHSSPLGFSTRAVWSGQEACPATGATIVPVYQTATFTLPEIGVTKGFDYSRTVNPTRSAMERQLAALEGGTFASAFASGMAAVAGATSLLSCGDHIIATRDIYGGTHRLFTTVLSRYGIEVTFVDTSDARKTWAAARPNTRLLWLETPSNPLLRLCDLEALARLRPAGALIVADNTFASPFLQQPLALGADMVVHSTTKYIGGHSDVIGGAVVTNDREIAERVAYHQNCVGAVPGPWDAYLTMRGAKTLGLRMRAHSRNAQVIAEFLAGRHDVAAGSLSGPRHASAARARKAANERIRRHRLVPSDRRPRARALDRNLDLHLRARGLVGRSRIADLQPGKDDARVAHAPTARTTRYHRRSAAPLGRNRRGRGPRSRSSLRARLGSRAGAC